MARSARHGSCCRWASIEQAEAVQAAVEGPLTAMCPASIIQMHKEAFVILNKESASKLKGTYVDTWETIVFE